MLVGSVTLVLLVIIGIAVFAFVYKVPSCTDNTQNQGEQGVDCGGPCTYLCTAQLDAPTVLFARGLALPGSRTDVIAYIQNPNKRAEAKGVPYVIELHAADATLIARSLGFIDLPAGETVPLFVRAAVQGSSVARAFVRVDTEKIAWTSVKAEYRVPRAIETTMMEGVNPRVSAKLANETYSPMYNVRAVVVVYDSQGTAIAASETLVPAIAAQSSVPVTFTWNESFIYAPARFEIISTVPLP